MKQLPKVTIIIPNYNHCRFLEKRIQSVLNQSFQDFEVIYIDDASTDESNNVFSKLSKDKRIRAIFNKKNSGIPFRQWNRGVKIAKGDYIWIAESDDYANSRFLEMAVKIMDENPTLGLVYCQSMIVNDAGDVLGSAEEYTAEIDKFRWQKDYINGGINECINYLSYKNTIPNASAVLIKKNTYKKAGYAIETMKCAGDWMMWVKILLISDIAFIAEPLNYYRVHPHTVRNMTLQNGVIIEEMYQVLQYIQSKVHISEELLDKRLNYIMDQWISFIISHKVKISWQNYLKIYQIARKTDPRFKIRLVQQLTPQLIRILISYVSKINGNLNSHLFNYK